jgi:hypothetical protein
VLEGFKSFWHGWRALVDKGNHRDIRENEWNVVVLKLCEEKSAWWG